MEEGKDHKRRGVISHTKSVSPWARFMDESLRSRPIRNPVWAGNSNRIYDQADEVPGLNLHPHHVPATAIKEEVC